MTSTAPAPADKSVLPTHTREIHLAARPTGEPTADAFALATAPLPELADGQVLVRNRWMSVDPYMRGRMNDVPSYMPPFALDAPLDGSALGEVVASRAADIPVGATVVHFLGWREHAVVDGATATVVDTTLVPEQAYLGVLGATGLTAYVALTDTAPVREGDVVFVSAAAGAVGSVAGQIARKLGARTVIGSAGGPAKAAALTADFGYDAALDHRAGDLAAQLADAAPDGIDVYLDNVGGGHLQAAIGAMRHGGRIALVGAISQYNATEPATGPNNLYYAAGQEITLRGMLITNHLARFPEWIGKAAEWLADGSLRTKETVVEGLENAPTAFRDMMRGANTGKMLVRLSA
ncbi:NADP-dependent oxidoreductase [Yinghuangia seranimata]|uniref:NADP-dependent oxidoreductase n=1 Tax=Yinghuangia seranimata TaxID=408067 RepID=UPI00248D2192|nr:NADP-dependent oxidoreductase [Yinghuangia seranimata]MDI2131822.1 NADP-dependent oxidoreductase [Yinghuangia seranimata]